MITARTASAARTPRAARTVPAARTPRAARAASGSTLALLIGLLAAGGDVAADPAPVGPAPAAPADPRAPEAGAAAASAAVHLDVEIDPTAYALDGNSLHVGIGRGHLRLDLGSFALAIPGWVHGDDAFDVSFHGFGAKLQWFPRAAQRGLFVGAEAGLTEVLVQRRGAELAAQHHQLGLGVQVGYRISLIDGFYATPWIGVGYQLGARDVTLGDATFRASAISVFPAVHIGYAFR